MLLSRVPQDFLSSGSRLLMTPSCLFIYPFAAATSIFAACNADVELMPLARASSASHYARGVASVVIKDAEFKFQVFRA